MEHDVFAHFFMPKYGYKERQTMFTDEILERIFRSKDLRTIPIGCQSTTIRVIEQVLEEVKGEKPYATISDLFTADE